MARAVFQPFCETEVNLLLYVEIWRDTSLRSGGGGRGVVEQEATPGKGKLAVGEVIFIVFRFCCCRHSLDSHILLSRPSFLLHCCDCESAHVYTIP